MCAIAKQVIRCVIKNRTGREEERSAVNVEFDFMNGLLFVYKSRSHNVGRCFV